MNRMGQGDTEPGAERVLLELYRSMDPGQKLALAAEGWECARALAWTGLLQRFPQATDRELFRRFVDAMLGPELAALAYGPLEDWR